MSDAAGSEARNRSRSPRRSEDGDVASEGSAQAPQEMVLRAELAVVPRPTGLVPYHKFDVTTWNVKATRDKVGKPRINVYGPTFNLHPAAEGDRPAEPWSEMPMGIFTEYEGVPVSNYKLSFRVSSHQDDWITNVFDEWAIDILTSTSTEWSTSKNGLKRDQVQKDYQPTIRRKEGFDPLVSMNYSSKGMEKFHTVVHYLDAKEDGTWSSEPRRPVTGDAGLLDLMGEHKFRKAKVRVEARLSGFAWQGKNIYARWELSKVYVKAPHVAGMSDKMAPSEADVLAMLSIE